MQVFPLSFVKPGSEATVRDIRAGCGLLRHLTAMGIYTGSRVTVLCADRGSLIISVAGSRYALSCGMAMKILVGTGRGRGE